MRAREREENDEHLYDSNCFQGELQSTMTDTRKGANSRCLLWLFDDVLLTL